MEQLNFIENDHIHGKYCDVGGACYGIDRVMKSLFLHAKFVGGEKEATTSIENKVIQSTNGVDVEIKGWDNLTEFLTEMETTILKEGNPLGSAIQFIQSFSSPSNSQIDARIGGDFNNQLTKVVQSIDDGAPVGLMIKGDVDQLDGVVGHQVHVIGYEINKESNKIEKLIVLNNNYPKQSIDFEIKGNEIIAPGWSKVSSFQFSAPKGARKDLWVSKSKKVTTSVVTLDEQMNNCLRKK